ncbi:amino acid transporter AVT1B [Physcomitrium patens]|uniref:amino acid transporter AVT1B n=1 Tax=Physcomitrium patens TaxID=3218 RepID=UPI000D1624E6|nr:amino acid transporter AVT1B-like [Physcomitrium patens]|eukprot:XP_024370358.1 amino acid transporter AVT1B-like [Physcomitrella patens]
MAAQSDSNEYKEPLLRKLEHQLDNTCSLRSADVGHLCCNRKICRQCSEQGSSFFQSLFNGMNVLTGVGILSTPYAAAKGGWLSLILLLFFALICCYTAILLRRCLDSDPYIRSYRDVGEASFGKWGRWIVSILLYLELYAVTVEFLIMEGDNLAHRFPSASISLGPTRVVASLLIVLTVGRIGVLDGVGFHHHGTLVHWNGLPVAAGLCSFCYCGHAVFPSVYCSLRNRTQFSLVVVLSFILCTILYDGIAAMGYTMFGDELQSQITLNLPHEAPASQFAIWVTLINPFAKYALTLTPVVVALEEFLPHSVKGSREDMRFWGTILRTLIVISTVIVALSIPFFGLLMAFIGSLLSATVSIILPCLCYLKIYGHQLSDPKVSCVGAVLSLGILVAIGGTYFSVVAIIENL